MPWNNQSGGGWKSGGGGGGGGPWGQGPWGQGPGGGQPPDLEEFFKRGQDRVKQVMGGSGLPGPLLFLAAVLGCAVLAWYAFFFRVNPDELGVVMRFGEFVRQEPPGLHFRLPYPIEEVHLPKVTRQNIIEVGMRSGTGGAPSAARRATSARKASCSPAMRTSSTSISSSSGASRMPLQYLFNIQNPETTVKEVAESAMREVVGQSNIAPLLTEARQKTEVAVQQLMQTTLDSYNSGIRIDQVQLQKVDPPAEVIDAFRDVQAARADKERLQNEAYAYANRIVPEARGEAERILQGAEGLQAAGGRRGQRPDLALPPGLRGIPQGARGDAPAHVPGDHGARVRRHRQDHHGHEQGRAGGRPYLPLNELPRKPAQGATDHARSAVAVGLLIVGLAIAAVYAAAFIVHQNEQALVLRFGDPRCAASRSRSRGCTGSGR